MCCILLIQFHYNLQNNNGYALLKVTEINVGVPT